MGSSQLLLILLQLSPILALLNFHCITNKDEFTVGGWSSSARIEFAKTERDLPAVFQGQMTAADGIFFLRGDGVDSFMTIDSPFSLNLRPPVNMYIRYYAHIPVITNPSQGAVVYPDPDFSTRDLRLLSDFIWQNETIKIDEGVANADEIAIWFQNAQIGDFLLIDSLIITEGATLSDDEMVALCSPSTSPVPTSTSTTASSSPSSATGSSSLGPTAESSSTSTTEAGITCLTTPTPPSTHCLIECIDTADDFVSTGWLSLPSYTYAQDSASLPNVFQGLSGSGIFYFEGGVNSFVILRELMASNRTCDESYLYVKYCTFTSESSSGKLVVSPAGLNPGGGTLQQLPLAQKVAWKEIVIPLNSFREYAEIRGQGFTANEYILFDKIGLVAGDILADVLEDITQCARR